MKLDVMKWKAEISRIENEIRAQKAAQRERYQPRWEKKIGDGWPFNGYKLRTLKYQATRLYVLRAVLRGRTPPYANTRGDLDPDRLRHVMLEQEGLGRAEPVQTAA